MGKRYFFIDSVKGIAIISVVLGHLFAMVAVADEMVNPDCVIRFLSVYELAVFFLTCGFLMADKKPEALLLKNYGARRFKKLMPVYLIFSFLYLFQDVTLANVVHTVTGFGISVLWFLPTLLLSEIIWLIVRKLKWVWAQAVLSAFLAAAACVCGLFLQAQGENGFSLLLHAAGEFFVLVLRACVGQLFVGVGYALNIFLKKVSGRQAAAATVLCLTAGVICSLSVKTADWRIMNIRGPVFWLAAASTLGSGLILIFYGMEKHGLHIRILERAGRESLLIMCTHLQFGIMPTCISLGYRASGASSHAKVYVFWGVILFSLAAVETALILIKGTAINTEAPNTE